MIRGLALNFRCNALHTPCRESVIRDDQKRRAMAANMLLVTLLPTLVTFLVTSGVWVGVFFIVGLNQPSATNNYYYGQNTSQTTLPPPIPTYPPLETCPAAGKYSECSVDCEFQVCESVPDDLYPGVDRGTWTTTKCWLKLIESAKEEIVIGSYYWTLLLKETDDCTDKDLCDKYSVDGQQIFDGLIDAAKRGISIRIAMNDGGDDGYTMDEPLAIRDINPEKVRVRALNFPRFLGAGILHTKSWAVDGKHSYVGSANFDWRSLTQVKEIGVATFNCACVAEDVQRMLDIYWYMGAEDAVVPPSWPAEYTTNANHDHPYNIPRHEGPATAIHFSSAPPQLDSCGRDSDIDAMVKLIDEAEDYLYMAVMDYAPSSLYDKPNTYYDKLDAAIKRAAFDRFVDVKFMMSKWAHTKKKSFSYIHEFDDFSYYLPCKPNVSPCQSGKIEAKIFQMPEDAYAGIPYARVQHTKYFVTEKAAYIGTSNWSSDYWISTGGIGIGVRSADAGGKEQLVEQVKNLYMQDFTSDYAIPIYKFTINGTLIDN
ncbi:hypothetical protein PRIPAC_76014 [Pristionchus pacificus]|uniref:Uncharacterized protein n=1 Tax=Pristionchus pacificus TaxID=54126 RepID=A0A2A6BZK7_PRIPA|nr:hypothetical protein PRIPAC_76014 [Pristionchus pacificus]|eukprot:PDM71355.1 hypothetical protein PRIPAC_37762 [Pristionchus pacificus]